MCTAQLSNGTAQALCCAGILNDPTQCALCPNPDLAGIGVRVAFYVQSLVNALLIAFSPSDSVPTAWAGTLLTLALVIAGFVSKHNQNLTLHHATLVLNFATLSTISSLAVAPMLPIWRLSPAEYYERHRRRHALVYADDNDPRHLHNPFVLEGSLYANTQKQRVKAAQRRQREILSIVLLLQVVLQWAWGIFLFVDPHYSQPELSESTRLVLFMAPFETGRINNSEDHPAGFLLWAAWILACLCITMLLVVNLAMSGSAQSQTSLNSTNTGTGFTSSTPIGRQWEKLIRESLYLQITRRQAFALLKAVGFAGLWVVFIATSEWQKALNCIFTGDGDENDFGGLGQITAIFVSLAPLWSLSVALYRYPALRRKRQRLRLSAMRASGRRNDDDVRHGERDEADHLLRTSHELSPLTQHLLLPSDETLREPSGSFEMDVLSSFPDGEATPLAYPKLLPTALSPDLHHHQPSSLKTTATPLAIVHSDISSSSGSGSLNRRQVQRPRGPRDGPPRSPQSPPSATGTYGVPERAV